MAMRFLEFTAAGEHRAVDAQRRRVSGYASTGSMDRHGTVIEPEAFRDTMPQFLRNPVVLASHIHWYESASPPVVAKVIDWRIDQIGLFVTIEFAATEEGEFYWQLYRDGFMNGFSVGFRAVAHEEREREDGSGTFVVFTKVELLEISCVAVPSNRESLVMRGGVLDDAEMAALKQCSELVTRGAPGRRAAPDAERLAALEREVANLLERAGDMEREAADRLGAMADRLRAVEATAREARRGVDALRDRGPVNRDRDDGRHGGVGVPL